MGNIIKDFWMYQYKKLDRDYFGMVEVIEGANLANPRKSLYIKSALDYTMKYDVLSHMTIQTYLQTLGKLDKKRRDAAEEAFYPFILEFEPIVKEEANQKLFLKQYKDTVEEAMRTVKYCTYELGMDENNILIMMNNSRSIYLLFNPVSYGLKPRKDLHTVYKKMYEMLDEELNFKYTDKSFYSSNKLMKTPNTYYKGGYFTKVEYSQLQDLYNSKNLLKKRALLTSRKKSLDYYIPVTKSYGLSNMYQMACDEATEEYKERIKNPNKGLTGKCTAKCIQYIEDGLVEEGCRNFALVSVAIHYKNQGYSKAEVLDKLVELADKWEHDETYSTIKSKVNIVFRLDKKFSCEYARTNLVNVDMTSACANCPYNKELNTVKKIKINSKIINELWSSKASTRHYVMYLELSKKRLFGKWFNPEALGMDGRVLRELCKHTSSLVREYNRDTKEIFIENIAVGNVYTLPKEFLENEVYVRLEDSLKHYLKLLIKGYKGYDRYIVMRVSKERIQKDLGYKNISGVYKLIEKLKELGLAVTKKGYLVSVYYDSMKVTNMDEYKARKAIRSLKNTYGSDSIAVGSEEVVESAKALSRKYRGNYHRGSPG